MNVKKVSIGIPAYLEEATIKGLLSSLISQKTDGFIIQEIIVIADGSTDRTADYAKQVNDKRIIVVEDKKRLGKTARLNQIFRMFTGDVLFLMDADIQIYDKHLLGKVVQHTNFDKEGLTAINAMPIIPFSFFEQIINTSIKITKDIAQKWQNGDNYLSFKGCFLALNRNFAKSLPIPENIVNDDAYLYFAAKQKGFAVNVCKDAVVYYKSPASLSDHMKQSSRYQSSQEELQKYFGNLSAAYKIPLHITLASTLKFLAIRPIYTIGYFIVRAITVIKRDTQISNLWNIAVTTKGV